MLREEKARGSAVGEEADRWTSKGNLVPDELALRIVWSWIDGRKRFILDGFPRTVGQAAAFDQGLAERALPLDAVYFLNLPDAVVQERMTSRLTCEKCGAVFNEKFHGLASGAPCPQCGGALGRRNDDTYEALAHRLSLYREHTVPVADHYRALGLLQEIDVRPGRDAVFKNLYSDMIEEEVAA